MSRIKGKFPYHYIFIFFLTLIFNIYIGLFFLKKGEAEGFLGFFWFFSLFITSYVTIYVLVLCVYFIIFNFFSFIKKRKKSLNYDHPKALSFILTCFAAAVMFIIMNNMLSARASMQSIKCGRNLEVISTCLESYAEDNNGNYPSSLREVSSVLVITEETIEELEGEIRPEKLEALKNLKGLTFKGYSDKFDELGLSGKELKRVMQCAVEKESSYIPYIPRCPGPANILRNYFYEDISKDYIYIYSNELHNFTLICPFPASHIETLHEKGCWPQYTPDSGVKYGP